MEIPDIKNYKIRYKLGEGGMASVYLADDLRFNSPVAIKILNQEYAYNKNIRTRFIAEARSIFRMSHPYIIRVTDLIDEDNVVAFVMQYEEGKTLKDVLAAEGPLPEQQIRHLLGQILEALSYVHKQGLVHRDIKPSNFILNKDGDIKLLDFGIAKNMDRNSAEYTITATSQHMGTPMYMSPEQIRDSKNVSPASDIYSLGVVLWQMVTGKKPYDANTLSAFDIQTRIVSEPLALTNTRWDTVIQKATVKKDSERYQDISSFRKDLQHLENSSNAPAGEEDPDKTTIAHAYASNPAIQPVRKPVQNKRNRTGYYITYAGLIVLAGIVYFLVRPPAKNGTASELKDMKDTAATVSPPVDTMRIADTVSKAAESTEPYPYPRDTGDPSYLDKDGVLVFRSDCYIIVQGSYKHYQDAEAEVARLRELGFKNAGYLWIPYYRSLSGLPFYATFFGPYASYEECYEDLKQMPRNQKFYYAKKVSMQAMVQQEIRY